MLVLFKVWLMRCLNLTQQFWFNKRRRDKRDFKVLELVNLAFKRSALDVHFCCFLQHQRVSFFDIWKEPPWLTVHHNKVSVPSVDIKNAKPSSKFWLMRCLRFTERFLLNKRQTGKEFQSNWPGELRFQKVSAWRALLLFFATSACEFFRHLEGATMIDGPSQQS